MMSHEEFEQAVMNKLLEGEDEIFTRLREQYTNANVTSREFTGCGFFTYFDVDVELRYNNINGRIDDVMAEITNCNEEYLFFILYIENGKFDVLECFTTLDSWNYDYGNTNIKFCYEDKRVFEIS